MRTLKQIIETSFGAEKVNEIMSTWTLFNFTNEKDITLHQFIKEFHAELMNVIEAEIKADIAEQSLLMEEE